MIKPQGLLLLGMALCILSCSNGSGGSDDETAGKNPVFGYIADSWVDGVFSTEMDDYWHEQGIAHSGTNYYLFPKPVEGTDHSCRFDPLSPYFQSWIGLYTVRDRDDVTYGIDGGVLDQEAVIKLGIADQTGWLKDFARIPDPRVILDGSVPVTCEETTIDGEPGWRLTCRLLTQADVGEDNLQDGLPALLTVPANCWSSRVSSYQEIMTNIVFYVWYSAENRELNMLYLTGSEYLDLQGIAHDYLPDILPELEEMARNVTVR